MQRAVSGDRVAKPPSGRAPERRTHEGRYATLEALDLDRHAEPLFRVSHDTPDARKVWRYLPDGPFDDVAGFRDCFARMAGIPDRAVFAVRERAGDRLGGMATYLDIRPPHGAAEIGYIWFAPFLQRSAAATEALFVMLRHAFDDLGYRRMQWRCNALNERSRAAALRLGFTYEGIFYHHMVVKGCNRDTAWYSMLDREWPRIRANFEAWLASENFDAQGRQRRSLGELNRGAP